MSQPPRYWVGGPVNDGSGDYYVVTDGHATSSNNLEPIVETYSSYAAAIGHAKRLNEQETA